jgi:hypothetical protein
MKPFYVVLPMFLIFFIFLLSINQYSALELILLVFFVGVIVFIGINYFFGVEITSTLSSLFSKPKVDIDIVDSNVKPSFFNSISNKFNQPSLNEKSTQPSNEKSNFNQPSSLNESEKSTTKPEVYHINGKFDYSMARSVCKAYDATLATLNQIKDTYKKGGEWCDYGWSEDEMVLYPTQESSWKKYQEGNKQQCGLPGINGGYNTYLNQQLGVNCYGVKPTGKMPIIQMAPIEKKTFPKQGTVSPFNYTQWNA